MRADAQRNSEKLLAAATELFQEHGLQVSLKEIARRAGVSHGTLYNLFGTREALIDRVVTDLAADRLGEVADHALSVPDAWDGFVSYLEKVCELQVTDPAVADVLSRRYPGAERLLAVCAQAYDAATTLIERAQRSGALRPDFTAEDLLFVFGSNAMFARATADVAPAARRRNVAFLLDGLRTEAAKGPLPEQPLSPAQMYQAIGRMSAEGS